MLVFYVLFLLLFAFSLFFKKSKVVGIVAIFILAFFSAFRGVKVGSDTINYYNNNFDKDLFIQKAASNSYEYCFLAVSETIKNMGWNPRLCLYFLTILTFVFLYKASSRFYKSDRTYLVMSIFVFYCLANYSMSLNIARQIAASCILLYAYTFIERKKIWPFLITVLFASSIHISSILFIFIYPVCLLKYERIISYKFILVVSIFFLFFMSLMCKDYFFNMFFSDNELFSVYERYVDQTEKFDFSISGLILLIIELSIKLFVLFELFNRGHITLSKLLLISIIVEIVFSMFYGNVARIRHGITIVEVPCLATYFSYTNKDTTRNIAVFILFSIVFGYDMLSGLSRGAYEIIPYYLDF